MKYLGSLSQTIITTFIGIVITIVLQTLFTYYTQDQAEITFNPPTKIQDQYYVSVLITNYSNNVLDNVLFSIPEETTVSQFSANSPVTIRAFSDNSGVDNEKRVQISGINPRETVQIMIPILAPEDYQDIRVVNLDKLHISKQPVKGLISPLARAVKDISSTILIYSILYGVFMFVNFIQIINDREIAEKKNEKAINQAKEELQIGNDRSEKSLKEATELTNSVQAELQIEKEKLAQFSDSYTRIKIILLQRISDLYTKLDFWKDTIRKVLYSSSKDNTEIGKLFDLVTSNLKTYSTRRRDSFDLDSIKVMAGLFEKSEEYPRNAHKMRAPQNHVSDE